MFLAGYASMLGDGPRAGTAARPRPCCGRRTPGPDSSLRPPDKPAEELFQEVQDGIHHAFSIDSEHYAGKP